MAAGKEAVLGGMCAESPEFICVALWWSRAVDATLPRTSSSSPNSKTTPTHTCITGEKPWVRSPLSNAFLVVPTRSSEPSPSAMARTAPKCSGICRARAECQEPVDHSFSISLPRPRGSPDLNLTSASWRATNPGPHRTSRRSRPPPLSTVPSRSRHRAKMEPS